MTKTPLVPICSGRIRVLSSGIHWKVSQNGNTRVACQRVQEIEQIPGHLKWLEAELQLDMWYKAAQ